MVMWLRSMLPTLCLSRLRMLVSTILPNLANRGLFEYFLWFYAAFLRQIGKFQLNQGRHYIMNTIFGILDFFRIFQDIKHYHISQFDSFSHPLFRVTSLPKYVTLTLCQHLTATGLGSVPNDVICASIMIGHDQKVQTFAQVHSQGSFTQ